MELGKGKLLRTGLNALHQAIHPVHGLAWTDGRLVVLTVLHLHSEEPRFGDSTVIGQFEHVHGLYWGPIYATDTPSLLAVQHKKHVTVWQLLYNLIDKDKLVVSQTCEVSLTFPVLPQGCLWHPKKDILAVMTKQDACILHSVRSDNANVKAEVKSSGFIHCACWTKEGNRLVVAIGSTLYSYIWDDAKKTLTACSFCPIFDVGGYICAIESTVDIQVAVATELPLDRLCGLNSGIALDASAAGEMATFSALPAVKVTAEEFSMDGKKYSDLEKYKMLDSVAAASSGPINLSHILADHRTSESSLLLNLRRKDFIVGSGIDSSHLILVTFERKVTSTRKVGIPGILVPDILAFDPRAHVTAVASNTCNIVLVYSLTSSSMPNIQQIQLEKNERPKGLYFLNDKMLLVLVGKQKFSNPAFLPSSNSDKYIISLMVKEVVFEEESSVSSAGSQSALSFNSCMSIPGKTKYSENCFKDSLDVSRELLMPGSTITYPFLGKRRLIEEVKSPTRNQSPTSSASEIDVKASFPTLSASDSVSKNRPVTMKNLDMPTISISRPSSPHVQSSVDRETSDFPGNNLPPDKGPSVVHRNMERLSGCFLELQQALSEASDYSRVGKKQPTIYPSSQEPSFLYISCQKPLSGGDPVHEKRLVLLCDGKLRLSVVQDVFNISLVEMRHGSSWIVLTTDIEGFVPLTFRSSQEITIRDAGVRSKITVHSSGKSMDAGIFPEPVT